MVSTSVIKGRVQPCPHLTVQLLGIAFLLTVGQKCTFTLLSREPLRSHFGRPPQSWEKLFDNGYFTLCRHMSLSFIDFRCSLIATVLLIFFFIIIINKLNFMYVQYDLKLTIELIKSPETCFWRSQSRGLLSCRLLYNVKSISVSRVHFTLKN